MSTESENEDEDAIRADERARIRSLLPYHIPCCDNFLASVGDLVNENGETPSKVGEVSTEKLQVQAAEQAIYEVGSIETDDGILSVGVDRGDVALYVGGWLSADGVTLTGAQAEEFVRLFMLASGQAHRE